MTQTIYFAVPKYYRYYKFSLILLIFAFVSARVTKFEKGQKTI